jgi:hypothetical protein
MNDKLKARLVLEIQEEETVKTKGYLSTPYGVISAVLWVLEYSQQYGVMLLPTRGHKPVDKEEIHQRTKEMLQERVIPFQNKIDYSYTVKMAVGDMDEFLLRLGVFLVDTRKKYK